MNGWMRDINLSEAEAQIMRAMVIRRPPAFCMVLLGLVALALNIYSPAQSASRNGFRITANAINEPDKFAWQMFAEINRSANDGTRNVIWETWATDQDLYGDP